MGAIVSSSPQVGLGAWFSATSGTAATDLLVCAYVNLGGVVNLTMTSGGVTRQYAGINTDQSFCGMMPVKKGDTWSVANASACYCIPLGK